MEQRRRYLWHAILVVLALLLGASVAGADNLMLTGTVRSIDIKSGTVFMDIVSRTCPGQRKFKVDNAAKMEAYEGIKISFFIDSTVCKGSAVYRITKIERGGV